MKREPELVEWMDRPDCDPLLLSNTYRQFTTINKLLSGWGTIYRNEIRPLLLSCESVPSILDIGCGGGDIIRFLRERCKNDGIDVSFTGIDPDSRSIDYLDGLPSDPAISYRMCTSSELLREGLQFDLVLSNHLMHHLTEEELLREVSNAESLSRKLVLFSDIERSRAGFFLFRTIAPLLFKESYIVDDGLISIRKSFTTRELREVLPPHVIVQSSFPFRVLVKINWEK